MKTIFQYELNEYRDKTQNQTPHVDDEITKYKKKLDKRESRLFRLIERGKKMQLGDTMSKNDLKPPLLHERRRKKT